MAKKHLDINTATDKEIIHAIEEQWGEEISHIAFLEVSAHGRVYTCIDLGDPATITVDLEGWVVVKADRSNFGDVLGAI